MRIFAFDTKKGIHAWGPVTTVSTKIGSLGTVSKSDNWALVGLSINAQEIVDIRQCFNNEAYLYAMGNDLHQCKFDLVYTVFLGSKNCSEEGAFAALADGLNDYARNRISKKPQRSSITIGALSLYGWLVGIQVGSFSADTGTCQVRISFIMYFPEL